MTLRDISSASGRVPHCPSVPQSPQPLIEPRIHRYVSVHRDSNGSKEAIVKNQTTPNDAESILRAVTALVPQIIESREEIEHERRLPLPIVEALQQAGAFRMTMPRDWGGAEIDPLSQLRI